MPVYKRKNSNCYKVHNTTTKKCLTKKQATKQLQAIEANKHRHAFEAIAYNGFLYLVDNDAKLID
ncbi:MAG: hypothetical protein M0R17_03425 [Candidatus Omnitrophica bacterium]|jgi:plasmid maintenance system killer protein|nr:hypothetical protein [Candidatus Omnitrophota bacterium]